jgi:hypothetical protein
MFLNCQSVVAKILQKNIHFSYCCIVLHYHYDYHAWLPRFKKYCPAWGVEYAGIGLLYPFCFKKLKIGFLDFLGLPDATVFFCTSNFQTPCIDCSSKYRANTTFADIFTLSKLLIFFFIEKYIGIKMSPLKRYFLFLSCLVLSCVARYLRFKFPSWPNFEVKIILRKINYRRNTKNKHIAIGKSIADKSRMITVNTIYFSIR